MAAKFSGVCGSVAHVGGNVIWAESPLADVAVAVRQSAAHWATGAEELRAALAAATGVLARLPKIGALYEANESGWTREIACRRDRIFYRPCSDFAAAPRI